MKRLLQFDATENSYIILEAGTIVFEIPFQGLRFDSRAFYQGIYSDGRSANIKFENIAGSTNAKIGYVFRWLNDIIQEIQIELGGEDDDERDALLEGPSGEDSVRETKTPTDKKASAAANSIILFTKKAALISLPPKMR